MTTSPVVPLFQESRQRWRNRNEVVIDRGEMRKRKEKASKRFRDLFGHTPLSVEEEIPWRCRRLVIGTGRGALPVMQEVRLISSR